LIGGEELTVPPLGKLMINRSKEVSNATIVNIKLRHPMRSKPMTTLQSQTLLWRRWSKI
jgi:hypothetical protein